MQPYHKNVLILAGCQALFMSSTSMLITVAGLVGHSISPYKALATLPISAAIVGTALATLPASGLMRRMSRRRGFLIGTAVWVFGGGLGFYAVENSNFWLFVMGSLLVGSFNAFGSLYRFAATDIAPVAFRPKAISLVLAGGVAAGFSGPQLAKWTKDLMVDHPYQGAYLTSIALAFASMVLISLLKIPPIKEETDSTTLPERPLSQIVKQPVFITAVVGSMMGYGMMSLLMTGTPLAMVAFQHPFNDAATVIQWHVIAMYLPSFFTGNLIARWGELTVMAAGALLNFMAAGIAFSGFGLGHFWVALMLLGFGWNFLFIGGSSLLTRAYAPSERAKTQGINDFLIFTTTALTSLSSGQLLHRIGWEAVVLASIPGTAIALGAVLLFAWRDRLKKISPEST